MNDMKNKKGQSEILFVILMLIVALSIATGVWVFKSYHEARVYTELTGKKVTTGQAMFVELRVIEPAKMD
jgi:hypothetical protein